MIRWIPFAFVRIALFFTAGIYVGIYYPDLLSLNHVRITFLICVIIYWIGAIVTYRRKLFNDLTQLKSSIGFIGLSAVFIAGYLTLISHTDKREENHLIHNHEVVQYYKATIVNSPQEKGRFWKNEAMVSGVKIKDEWKPYHGKIILYFSKAYFPRPYHYGDLILINGNPQLVPGAANPGEFDYQLFLGFRNTHHQHFMMKDQVKFIANKPPYRIVQYALLCRSWAENKLKKYVTSLREQGIISALVLGVTDGLDNELLTAYAASGTMHVLAVSGLHVGIIYWLITLILRPLNGIRFGKWILAIVSILILWAYAFITGLSPSVLRAVMMFSFVALARPGGYRTNIYNTLAASAFVLLLYDPYMIMSVGFQLSYLAVLGIVYLHRGIYRLWEPDTMIMNKLWEMTAISIAAQVATFSLGLLYFHQFPNYFIFSNLLVIPGSSLALILGLAVLAFSFFSTLASFLGYLLTWVIKIMNYVVFTVEDLPFSLVDNIYISVLQCCLLMGIIVLLILVIRYKKLSYLKAASVLVFVYSVVQWIHFIKQVNQQKIVVYSVKGHNPIDLIDCGQAYFFADSSMRGDAQMIRFHIKPNRLINGINKVIDGANAGLIKKLPGCRIIYWKGTQILLINERNFKIPDSSGFDYLIIEHNAITNLKFIHHLNFEKLILASNNSVYIASRLLKQAAERKIKVHSVSHEGAFIDIL